MIIGNIFRDKLKIANTVNNNTHLVHTSNLQVTEDGNVESTCYVDPHRPEKEVEHEYCAECVDLSRQ